MAWKEALRGPLQADEPFRRARPPAVAVLVAITALLMLTPYSYSISPGFNKAGEPAPRLARDPARWSRNVRDMIASNARFQLVTTMNEWGEGTSVESAQEWSSPSGHGLYLDTLHADG
jgi:hypothetical protein